MKKNVILVLLFMLTAGIFAQTAQERPRNRPLEQPQTVSVSGALSIVNGHIAVQSGSTVFYVAGIQRFVGFIDGLKEGAQVMLDGYVHNRYEDENTKLLFVTKLTLNGKSYDTAPAGFDRQAFAGPGNGGFDRDTRGPWGHHRGSCRGPGRDRRAPYRN
jgi:hypothetical protein